MSFTASACHYNNNKRYVSNLPFHGGDDGQSHGITSALWFMLRWLTSVRRQWFDFTGEASPQYFNNQFQKYICHILIHWSFHILTRELLSTYHRHWFLSACAYCKISKKSMCLNLRCTKISIRNWPCPRTRMGKGRQSWAELRAPWSHKLRKLCTNGNQK